MARKKHGGSAPGSHRIFWKPVEWAKVAREYAKVFVRLSQGGTKPPFGKVFSEAQLVLPKSRQKTVPTSVAAFPEYFEKAIQSELAKLTQTKTAAANGTEHPAVNGSKIEVITSSTGFGFAVPQGIELNENFRTALAKAGFKCVEVKDLGAVASILDHAVGGIENMVSVTK